MAVLFELLGSPTSLLKNALVIQQGVHFGIINSLFHSSSLMDYVIRVQSKFAQNLESLLDSSAIYDQRWNEQDDRRSHLLVSIFMSITLGVAGDVTPRSQNCQDQKQGHEPMLLLRSTRNVYRLSTVYKPYSAGNGGFARFPVRSDNYI